MGIQLVIYMRLDKVGLKLQHAVQGGEAGRGQE